MNTWSLFSSSWTSSWKRPLSDWVSTCGFTSPNTLQEQLKALTWPARIPIHPSIPGIFSMIAHEMESRSCNRGDISAGAGQTQLIFACSVRSGCWTHVQRWNMKSCFSSDHTVWPWASSSVFSPAGTSEAVQQDWIRQEKGQNYVHRSGLLLVLFKVEKLTPKFNSISLPRNMCWAAEVVFSFLIMR